MKESNPVHSAINKHSLKGQKFGEIIMEKLECNLHINLHLQIIMHLGFYYSNAQESFND